MTRCGWQDLHLQRYPSLGSHLSAAYDVPDLALLPGYLPDVRSVTFHAALEARWEQLALWCMAGLTRLKLVRNWSPMIPLFHYVSEKLIGMGSQKGGMHLRMSGPGATYLLLG